MAMKKKMKAKHGILARAAISVIGAQAAKKTGVARGRGATNTRSNAGGATRGKARAAQVQAMNAARKPKRKPPVSGSRVNAASGGLRNVRTVGGDRIYMGQAPKEGVGPTASQRALRGYEPAIKSLARPKSIGRQMRKKPVAK